MGSFLRAAANARHRSFQIFQPFVDRANETGVGSVPLFSLSDEYTKRTVLSTRPPATTSMADLFVLKEVLVREVYGEILHFLRQSSLSSVCYATQTPLSADLPFGLFAIPFSMKDIWQTISSHWIKASKCVVERPIAINP
jgi:hypothetical protein